MVVLAKIRSLVPLLLFCSIPAARAHGEAGAKPSPYAPTAAFDDQSVVAAKDPGPYEVRCNDPLEKVYDCQKKARALCQGEFVQLKLVETAAADVAPRRVQLHRESLRLAAAPASGLGHEDTQRSLLFRCGSAASSKPVKAP